MAINVKLEGDGIVPHLVKTREMDQEAKRHFHFKSKLWRAIQEHIQSKDCVLFKRKGTVATYSAGPGIGIEDAYIPHNLPGETQMMVFKIRVSYWRDPEDDSRDTFDEREFIHFPADLESNFTQEKFDLWINTQKEKRDAEQAKTDIAALDRLIKQYPVEATTLMQQIAPPRSKTPPKPKSKRSSRTKTSR